MYKVWRKLGSVIQEPSPHGVTQGMFHCSSNELLLPHVWNVVYQRSSPEPVSFYWGSSCRLLACPRRKVGVQQKLHSLFNSWVTLIHPYQSGNNGNCLKSQILNTNQKVNLQVDFSRDSSLWPAILTFFCINIIYKTYVKFILGYLLKLN